MAIERHGSAARIAHLLQLAEQLEGRCQAEMARHICVLSSGFLEVSCRELLCQFVSSQASPMVAKYVTSELGWFQNAKVEKIGLLLSSFDESIRNRVFAAAGERCLGAVDSVVTNRHNIAHGRNSGITLATIRGYHALVVDFVGHLERELGVSGPPKQPKW